MEKIIVKGSEFSFGYDEKGKRGKMLTIVDSISHPSNGVKQLMNMLDNFLLSDSEKLKVLKFYQAQLLTEVSASNGVYRSNDELRTKKLWAQQLQTSISAIEDRLKPKSDPVVAALTFEERKEVLEFIAERTETSVSKPAPATVPYVSPGDQLWQAVTGNGESADLEWFRENIFHFELLYSKTDNSLCIESKFGDGLGIDSESFFDIDELVQYALSPERPYRFYLPLLLYSVETELPDKSVGSWSPGAYQTFRQFILKAHEQQCRFDLGTIIRWYACDHAASGSGAYYPGVSVFISDGGPIAQIDQIEKDSFPDVMEYLIDEYNLSREQSMIAANILVAQFMHQLENINNFSRKVVSLMNDCINEAREFILSASFQ